MKYKMLVKLFFKRKILIIIPIIFLGLFNLSFLNLYFYLNKDL